MTKEELENYVDKYLIDKFGAKTGNNHVRQALLDGYNLALRQKDFSGSLQLLTVNRVSEMMQKLSKETWIAIQGDEHGWIEWWNERNKLNVNSNSR